VAPPGARGAVLDAVCAALALAVPLAVTALRVGPSPQWRDDLAVVQGLGFVPVGGEGCPAALLAELLALLPVGGRVLRAGLVGALGAGLAGRALYASAFGLLRQNAATPLLAPLLALAAALTATLSPTWQHEGTAAGGAALAAGLGLVVLVVRDGAPPGHVRAALVLGALLGLTLAESRVTAAVIGAALVARAIASGLLPTARSLAAFVAGGALLWGFCLVPLFVRPFSSHASMTLGVDLSTRLATSVGSSVSRLGPLATWAGEMGPVALGLGLAGLGWGLFRPGLRASAAALVVLVAAAAALPVRGPSALAADPFASIGLLAVAALSVAAVLGVQTAALALQRARVPLAAPAAALLVVFHFTLVFAAVESSSDVVTETTGLGADVWTDEALGELPPNALLLVHSPTLAWRLWAARVVRGERPDLVVVPLALVGRGTVAAELVRDEPAVAPLVLDLAMTGRAGEYALAALADARPVYVELDPEWDRRLLDHLRPTPLWLGFAPHTLGRSDRASALVDEEGRRAFRRVLAVAKGAPGGDAATLSVLGANARGQALVLAALGDRDSARRVLADLGRIEPGSAFAAKLEERLASRAPFDARALLAGGPAE
jgi:hypothetical protein